MTRNTRVLRSELPTYFLEKQRKLREMEAEAHSEQDHAMQMLCGLLIFGAIVTVIAIVYSLQQGLWR